MSLESYYVEVKGRKEGKGRKKGREEITVT